VAVAIPVISGVVLTEQEIVTLDGQKIVGPLRSLIVMICIQVELLPHASVAVHVR